MVDHTKARDFTECHESMQGRGAEFQKKSNKKGGIAPPRVNRSVTCTGRR